MPKPVICNTSPLFYLHRIGQLHVLEKLYKTVVIPQTVEEELAEGEIQGEDVPNLRDYPWIKIENVRIPKFIGLIPDLGPGEAGTLALDFPEATVILDDRLARRIAMLQDLKVTGTAGVLLKAKQQRYIEAVAPLINQLIGCGFRLSKQLQDNILKLAGEK